MYISEFRIKTQINILFNISILLDVQANLLETSPFFVCPKGFGEHLFSNVYKTWDATLIFDTGVGASLVRT